MYTNIHNIILTVICLFEKNNDVIRKVIQVYQPDRNLHVFEGMRSVLSQEEYPSLEIEPSSASNSWFATRAQQPRYEMTMTLTVNVDNEIYGAEYISTVTTCIVELLTDPSNLQLQVINESRWGGPDQGYVSTVITDSFVESVTFSSNKEGTIRQAEFQWFALVNEPFPASKWRIAGDLSAPTIVLPKVITIP